MSKRSSFGLVALRAFFRVWLRPHRGHERLNAHDVHDPGQIDLGPGESMLVEVGAIVSFRASGSRTGDLTMPEQMAAKHVHDVSKGHLSFDVKDFRGKRRYGLAPQESRDSVRELLLAISAGEVRSLHLVVSIDIANPESPIKRIKEVNSTGWTPELRELRQPERRGSFSENYKERSALLHMSLN